MSTTQPGARIDRCEDFFFRNEPVPPARLLWVPVQPSARIGAVVSEFPMTADPDAWHFLMSSSCE
jgi:hypothetical protein